MPDRTCGQSAKNRVASSVATSPVARRVTKHDSRATPRSRSTPAGSAVRIACSVSTSSSCLCGSRGCQAGTAANASAYSVQAGRSIKSPNVGSPAAPANFFCTCRPTLLETPQISTLTVTDASPYALPSS